MNPRGPIVACSCLIASGWAASAKAQAQPPDSTVEGLLNDVLRPLITSISQNPWIQGVLVIFITAVSASLLTWILFRIIRFLTARTSYTLDVQLARLLQPPVYYTLLVIGLIAGITLMPLPPWKTFIIRAIHTITVIVWMVFLIRCATLILARVASLSTTFSFIQHRTVTLFDNIAKVVIFGAATYALFVIWHIDMTAWLASAGIVGIAVGFAAKDTLSNLFSGVFIIADAPYKVGDYIILDTGGRGKVTNIGLRSTRILTRDDIEVTVPNSIIGNSMIINQSGGPHEKMRIRLKVGVAYGSDIDLLRQVLEDIAVTEPLVCQTPEPRVRFRAFGASSLDFELLFWVDAPERYGLVQDTMNTKVYKRLNEAGIEIPYAKQDLYIKSLPETFHPLETDQTDREKRTP